MCCSYFQSSRSRTICCVYFQSTDSQMYHIGSPTDYYEFSNNTDSGDLLSVPEPFCLHYQGSFSGQGSMHFSARMHCICVYST